MMKLKHLIELIAELKPNTHLKYIRSDEHCEYIKVDLEEPRVFSKTPDGNEHSITFKKGLNVLVGENDSGKSAIMDAIKLVLGTTDMNWYRVEQEDFYKEDYRETTLKLISDSLEYEMLKRHYRELVEKIFA